MHPIQAAQNRRFSTARWPDDRRDLMWLDRQVDRLDRLPLAVVGREILDGHAVARRCSVICYGAHMLSYGLRKRSRVARRTRILTSSTVIISTNAVHHAKVFSLGKGDSV